MKTDEKLYHYKAKIDRVVDGDTVDVSIDLGFDMHSRQRVRLWGINTPNVARGTNAKNPLAWQLKPD